MDDLSMAEYEHYLKESDDFKKWRDRTVIQLPRLAARVFALRDEHYYGCGFHYDLERTLGYLIWKLNDFQSYPLNLREMVAHRIVMKVHLSELFKDVVKAEKEIQYSREQRHLIVVEADNYDEAYEKALAMTENLKLTAPDDESDDPGELTDAELTEEEMQDA